MSFFSKITLQKDKVLSFSFQILLLIISLVFAGHLLYSAFSAFSWQNFLMSDYGVYTNTLYNLSHGDGFKFNVDNNYLRTHLSFSLILLAPLMRLWGSVYLLIIVQWFFLIGGAVILNRIMTRLQIPGLFQSSLLLVWCTYPFTQTVLLYEFHGVAGYLLLIPWLLHCLLFNKPMVFVPWLCILGVREEAGLVILPLFLYMAVRQRWKGGYIYAFFSLVYVLIAIGYLYPLVNMQSLLEIRQKETSISSIIQGFKAGGFKLKAAATFWMLLPGLPLLFFFKRSRFALVTPVSLVWFISMISGFRKQYSLTFHYPSPIIPLVMTGLILAYANSISPIEDERRRRRITWMLSIWIFFAAAVAHYENGYFLYGKNTHRVYAGMNENKKALEAITENIPKEGILLTNMYLGPHVATRPDILLWKYWKPEKHQIEWILFYQHEYTKKGYEYISQVVTSGEFGVYRKHPPFVLLKRGYSTVLNETLYTPPVNN